MKIRRRMLAIFMLVIALVMALVVIAVDRMREISNDYMTTITHPVRLESTLRDFRGEYNDLRRLVSTILVHVDGTGMTDADKESLFSSASARYGAATAVLDKARAIVETNPLLNAAQREERFRNNAALRSYLEWYKKDVMEPAVAASRERDHGAALALLEPATRVALAVKSKLDEMIESATGTAAMHIGNTEERAKAVVALLVAISVIAAVMAVAMALYAADRIARPLIPLTEFMKGVAATGHIAFRPEDAKTIAKYAGAEDEIGLALSAAREFIARITEVGTVLAKMADGHLDVRLPLLSEHDALGIAIGKTLDGLNDMFGEINAASTQVATGSSQIADGAQSIASGAAEQASSIEELSTSIAAVAERTKRNAEMANHATEVAVSVTMNAEKGRIQMEAMLEAVARISQSSTEIGNVMKTIDSIAFQTNILSLNASVEAAHAGRHGKGFAVVADEVRRLAAKSAQAAKETEAFIGDAVEKTKTGVQIAEETSASLSGILTGIEENGKLMEEIARSSAEQSATIEQINMSIDQLSRVVQENSATAEQSATASREMSWQSLTLKDLITQFKLSGKKIEKPGNILPPPDTFIV